MSVSSEHKTCCKKNDIRLDFVIGLVKEHSTVCFTVSGKQNLKWWSDLKLKPNLAPAPAASKKEARFI